MKLCAKVSDARTAVAAPAAVSCITCRRSTRAGPLPVIWGMDLFLFLVRCAGSARSPCSALMMARTLRRAWKAVRRRRARRKALRSLGGQPGGSAEPVVNVDPFWERAGFERRRQGPGTLRKRRSHGGRRSTGTPKAVSRCGTARTERHVKRCHGRQASGLPRLAGEVTTTSIVREACSDLKCRFATISIERRYGHLTNHSGCDAKTVMPTGRRTSFAAATRSA